MMTFKTPIMVIGGGLTAEIMCVSLAYFGLEYSRLKPPSLAYKDARTTTINLASQKMLSHLNLWSYSAENSTKISDILVSQKSFGRDCYESRSYPYALNFSLNGQPMAWTVENTYLLESAQQKNEKSILPVYTYDGELHFNFGAEQVTITDDKGTTWQTELVIACDGANSPTRSASGLKSKSLAANQKAIIARVDLNQFHHNRAFQRFLPDGPIALMPIKQQEAALVWSITNKHADKLFELSDEAFQQQVINALGSGFDSLAINSKRAIWPLTPSISRSMGKTGLLLAGDSSHAIHPLAGMGFNLALGDIAVICDCLEIAKKRGLKLSHPSILLEYQARRRIEIEAILGVTQGLNRLFSYKSFHLKIIPSSLINFGLGVMDMLPIKKQLLNIATGGVLTSASLLSDES